MGKTCKLKAVSFQCMTKFTTIKEKKRKKKKEHPLVPCNLLTEPPISLPVSDSQT